MKSNDEILQFNKLLKLRTIFKSVSQISWNLSKLEKRYPFDDLSKEEIKSLSKAYIDYAHELLAIAEELRDELEGESNGRMD